MSEQVVDVAQEDLFHAQAAAGVLVFRALTYGIQVPIGAITYLIWRTKKNWRAPARLT